MALLPLWHKTTVVSIKIFSVHRNKGLTCLTLIFILYQALIIKEICKHFSLSSLIKTLVRVSCGVVQAIDPDLVWMICYSVFIWVRSAFLEWGLGSCVAHISDQSGHANSDSTSTQQNSAPLKSGTTTCNYAAIYCELNMNHSSLSKDKNYEYCHRLATGKLQGLSV